MAIDVRGFMNEYPEWGGLYKMADNLERKNLRQDQLAVQQAGKRNAAGTFLQNYLDPKDYLSGTAYDPMIIQGLQEAMQSGSKLAASGADTPTLMMALGPAVNRLAKYSTSAKTINKQVDDFIANMKADKQEGYNWAALKEEALRNAFYKTDETGMSKLDPDKADPSVNWVMKAIEDSPEKVTTPEAFDLYAKNAQMTKSLQDVTDTDRFGNPTRSKLNLTAQNYLQPVMEKGRVKEFVPFYDEATDAGEKLMHTFADEKGNPVKAPVRLLDEKLFESLKPGQIDYIRGQVKTKLKEYEDMTGEKISFNSPKAKLVARALAYDELNKPTRKATNIEYVQSEKLSPQQTTLNVHMSPEYQQSERTTAASRKQGRADVATSEEEIKGYKQNAAQSIGDIFNGKEDLSQIPKSAFSGPLSSPGGSKSVKDMTVYDVTNVLPGAGLKAGRGNDYKYKRIFYNPSSRSLIVENESGPEGKKKITNEEIPEANVGQFIYRIAEANGIPRGAVRSILDKMGYKGGKFTKAVDQSGQLDFESRKKKKSWQNVLSSPFGSNK